MQHDDIAYNLLWHIKTEFLSSCIHVKYNFCWHEYIGSCCRFESAHRRKVSLRL